MRFIIPVLWLLLAPWAAWAQSGSAGRVEYVAALAAPQTQRLLGAGSGHLYVLRATGQVEAVDAATGATTFALQNQLDGHALYAKAEAVAASDDTIYLVDSENNRVILYGMDGKYRSMFGARSGDAAAATSSGGGCDGPAGGGAGGPGGGGGGEGGEAADDFFHKRSLPCFAGAAATLGLLLMKEDAAAAAFGAATFALLLLPLPASYEVVVLAGVCVHLARRHSRKAA